MSYVDAGYAVALSTLLIYAVSLLARRRRWERAYEMSDQSEQSERTDADAAPASGERS
jgi:hypothetical protein